MYTPRRMHPDSLRILLRNEPAPSPSSQVMANFLEPVPRPPCERLRRQLNAGRVLFSLAVALFLVATLIPLL